MDQTGEIRYLLEHWRLHYTEGGIVAEGHLQEKGGLESGIEIQTSLIGRWRREEERIILYTMNSIYSCSLKEYIPASCSLRLLREVRSCAEESGQEELAGAERILRDIERARDAQYRSTLLTGGLGDAVILVWCGCDYPYLKRVVNCEEGRIETEDIMRPVAEVSAYMDPVSGEKIIFKPENSDCAGEYTPACLRGTGRNIVARNEGKEPFTVHVSDGRRITVGPQEQVPAGTTDSAAGPEGTVGQQGLTREAKKTRIDGRESMPRISAATR